MKKKLLIFSTIFILLFCFCSSSCLMCLATDGYDKSALLTDEEIQTMYNLAYNSTNPIFSNIKTIASMPCHCYFAYKYQPTNGTSYFGIMMFIGSNRPICTIYDKDGGVDSRFNGSSIFLDSESQYNCQLCYYYKDGSNLGRLENSLSILSTSTGNLFYYNNSVISGCTYIDSPPNNGYSAAAGHNFLDNWIYYKDISTGVRVYPSVTSFRNQLDDYQEFPQYKPDFADGKYLQWQPQEFKQGGEWSATNEDFSNVYVDQSQLSRNGKIFFRLVNFWNGDSGNNGDVYINFNQLIKIKDSIMTGLDGSPSNLVVSIKNQPTTLLDFSLFSPYRNYIQFFTRTILIFSALSLAIKLILTFFNVKNLKILDVEGRSTEWI